MTLFPLWTTLPFVALVLGIAVLPLLAPRIWAKHHFQVAVSVGCAAPVVAYLIAKDHQEHLFHSLTAYLSFVATIGALYVVASGIFVTGDIEATPRNNLAIVGLGSLVASLIGTTGASILMIRPLLRTNGLRSNRAHLVPIFILAVSNAGGMLTPLGDPPLLFGYLHGVPFLWTLRLFPYWVLYVGSIGVFFYFVERRAYAQEGPEGRAQPAAERAPIGVLGKWNGVGLLAIVGAVLLPAGYREATMITVAAASFLLTPASIHSDNGFSFGPMIEVAILFLGLFACLTPIEVNLAAAAPSLPIERAWHLFWGTGLLSAVLDNAPSYAAFSALARGRSLPTDDLVAGISSIKLVAVSVASVVMGATTYIGNGPNLMVKAIAERGGYQMPSFGRYALFAFVVLLPIHLVTTVALVWLDR